MANNRLSVRELNERLIECLSAGLSWHSDVLKKPLEAELLHPLPRRCRFYLYNLPSPPGGRTLGEHKIQLIVPGQGRGSRGNFDFSDGRLVFLVGYEQAEDVFVLWDAGLYPDFAYSMNVQVKAESVFTAHTGTVVFQERRLHAGPLEVVIAAPSRLLREAIEARTNLSLEQLLEGRERK